MDKVRRMLVTVQAAPDCIDVVSYAASLAEMLHAKLFILDIVFNPFAYRGWNLPLLLNQTDYDRLLASVRDRLRAMTEGDLKKRVEVETLMREGEPAAQIISVVEEERIDLLVLPAHEETRIEHFLSGKMTAKIVRTMPCSVLLVKQAAEVLCEPVA
jgi:nucleotide-binding universal stress UspA family protein